MLINYNFYKDSLALKTLEAKCSLSKQRWNQKILGYHFAIFNFRHTTNGVMDIP